MVQFTKNIRGQDAEVKSEDADAAFGLNNNDNDNYSKGRSDAICIIYVISFIIIGKSAQVWFVRSKFLTVDGV